MPLLVSVCNDGFHGVHCREQCDCGEGNSCDAHTGACICPPGYTGNNCTEGKWT